MLLPLLLQMAEAALQLKIEQAEDAVARAAEAVARATDAVVKAQAAFDIENGDNKPLYGQMLAAKEHVLVAEKIALAQFREKQLIQQRLSIIGSCLEVI